MKRLIVVTVFAAFAATSLFALNKGETELENDGWFRYTGVTKSMDFNNFSRSAFSLERGYVRLSHQWTNELFSKMTVDVLSSNAFTGGEGASVRLKEAYVDYLLPFTFMTAKITPGLQKNYFSLIAPWDYTTIEKSLADKEGIIASADYGLTLNGYLPAGLGEFELGGYNGSGYKKAFDSDVTKNQLNTNFDYVGNLRLTPFAGLSVGASIMTQYSDRSSYKNTGGTVFKAKTTQVAFGDTANMHRFGIAPNAKIAIGPFYLLGEYIGYNYTREYHYWASDTMGKVTDSTKLASDKKYAMNGFSVMPVLTLFGKHLDLVGRYDMWNVAAQASDGSMPVDTLKSHTMFAVGFNYHFVKRSGNKPGVELQVNWQHEQPKATSAKPTDTFMVQARWEWTGLITPQ